MWRLLIATLLLAGCNALFGIHEIQPDATGDPCVGVCECRVDADCAGAHTVCFDQVTSRTCTCAAGYAMGASGCAWNGVVDDPGFNKTPDQWVVGGTATLQPTATQMNGMQDIGLALLDVTDPQCRNGGQVSQAIVMPRRSRAEPLVVFATYSSNGGGHLQDELEPSVGIGLGWYDRPFQPNRFSFGTTRVCLGAAHYAPESSTGPGSELPLLAIPTSRFGFCGSSQSELSIDHLEIAPATPTDACPDPGQVPNGDAEGSGGWTFQTNGSGGVVAAIAPGVGANGTAGVRLFAAQRCDSAQAKVPISIPVADATGSPALTFYHSGSNGFNVTLDQTTLELSGTGQPTVDRYCIPAPLRGSVVSVQAFLYVGGSGTCTDVVNTQAVIDDVAVANDPACGTDPNVADPGFESGTAPVVLQSVPGKSTAAVVADSTAHGGMHDLALTVMDSCTNAYYSTAVATPAVSAGEGAGVSFWYKLSSGTSSLLTSSITTFAPTRDGQWHQGFACIDPQHPGRAQSFFVELSTSSGTCATIAPETAAIDDIAVVSTPMCPAM